MNFKDAVFGFECEKTFYKIGDEIDVSFHDGTHYDGTLENIHVEDREIIVDGFVFSLERVKEIIHLN